MALNQFPRRSFVGSSTLQTFTGTGSQTIFTLSSAQTQNECFVFVEDVAQVPGVDFTVNGTTLTFTVAPSNNAEIVVRGFGVPAPVTTVSDGSVTAAKLATGAIEAKLGYTPVSPTQLSNEVAALVDSAPTTLNTLNELAAALGDDPNYATTITNALGTKANTTDVNNALALKANTSSLGTLATVSPTGTANTTTFLRGDNSWQVVAVTPTAVSDQNNTSTGYFDLPSGTTAQRPASPNSGMIRYNSERYSGEIYNDGTWIRFASLLDGSTSAKAVPNTTSLSQVYSDFGYTGQQTLYLTSNDGTVIQTNTYKDGNNSVWILIAGIGDQTAGGTAYTGWYNQGRWTGINNAFGSLTTANREYKNKLYWDYYYSDILVMQGQSESASLYTDWYNNSNQVAYTSNNWLSNRGRTLTSFLSGNNGPNIATNGASGRVQIPVTFLKGSASASRGYFYTPNSQDELLANNVLDWGGQNNEGYRHSVINALGCQQNGVNSEHYSWCADVAGNYSARNFWATNYGSPWGVNPSSASFWYWLIWAKAN